MFGAICGDVIGSVYEHNPVKDKNFPLFSARSTFTDDTVLTTAIAGAILEDGDYLRSLRERGRVYPNAGYGGNFLGWLFSDNPEPYNSWGNGSAMRVSPVGFAFGDIDTVLREAARSAEVTHNHPEGIRGAQAVAAAVFYARTSKDRSVVKEEIKARFGYDLDRALDDIRPGYHFDVTCQRSVPEGIISFLESNSYEDAVRNAVSLGGDADTLACIAGGIAEAFYGSVPENIIKEVTSRLTPDIYDIVGRFYEKYNTGWRP